jgi:hypothetical protein
MPQSKRTDPAKIAQTVVELEKLIEETRALQNSLCYLPLIVSRG